MPFQPGQSGNPGGRPSAAKELRERIRERGEDLVEGLLAIALDTAESGKNRIAATRELLDRGYGKSPQPIDGDGEGGPIAHSIAVSFIKPKATSTE